MKKGLLFVLAAALGAAPAWALKAGFASTQGETTAYSCGFDSPDEMEGWNMAGWRLTANVSLDQADLKPFSSINPASVTSAACIDQFKQQDEAMVSPEILVPDGGRLRFYAAFNELFGIWGHMEVSVIDGSERKLLLNSFLWSQEDGNDASRWLPFSYDLSAYAGRKVRIEFRYLNTNGGDNVYIDDMTIGAPDTSPEATITIAEGASVQFTDLSEGAASWSWSFPGGTPEESSEQNPTVRYNTPGTYDVTLTVADASGATATATRTAYVQVKAQAPLAHIGLPEGCYMSPWTMCYVPLGTPVRFTDRSEGNPTEWLWTLPGTSTPTSTEQHPTVTYTEEGTHSLSLRAGNAVGSTIDEYRDAIQAGGSQYVWNIAPEESHEIAAIAMGWYGNYGGSNFLGLGEFAERFDGPAADATIDAVQAYFEKVTHVAASADTPIKVSIRKADAEGGMPGTVLGETSLPASELVDGYSNYDATTFAFDTPVSIAAGEAFFVVIGPFPNAEGESYYDVDDIALYCSPRRDADKGGHSTAYHFAYDEDENYNYLTTGKWTHQSDELISMALSPNITFEKKEAGIADVTADAATGIDVRRDGDCIVVAGEAAVYSTAGTLVARGEERIYIGALAPGVYVVRTAAGAAKIVL